jgi:hypothetical protein
MMVPAPREIEAETPQVDALALPRRVRGTIERVAVNRHLMARHLKAKLMGSPCYRF